MINIELDEEMEMPCPCQKCGEWFDLVDGYGSKKWFPKIVICERCHDEEEKEIEREEEIRDLKSQIDEAEFTIKEARARLAELDLAVPFKINTPNY